MIEEVSREIQSPKSQKENNPARLQAYFGSSTYLHQQDEISMFIKNFPIIRIAEVPSINSLIGLTIRQNELLAGKCQQNIALVKEMYLKHEELIKGNKQLKNQIVKIEHSPVREELANQRIRWNELASRYQHSVEILEARVREDDAQILRLKHQMALFEQGFRHLTEVMQRMSQGDFKRASELIKTANSLEDIAAFHLKNASQSVGGKWLSPTKEWLQQYIRQQKRKAKYSSKIKDIIESFCNRLKRVVKVVPANVLESEFQKEANSLLELVGQFSSEGKKTNQSSGKALRILRSEAQDEPFEELMRQAVSQQQQTATTKEELAVQLAGLRREFNQSKEYYETVLASVKQETQKLQKQCTDEASDKERMTVFYQELIATHKKQEKTHIEEVASLLKQIDHHKAAAAAKVEETCTAEAALASLKKMMELKEWEYSEQAAEKEKTVVFKLKQKDQALESEGEYRKRDKAKFEERISDLKSRLADETGKHETARAQNRELKNQMQATAQKLRTNQAKVEELHKSLHDLKHFTQAEVAVREAKIGDYMIRLQKAQDQSAHLKQDAGEYDRERQLQQQYTKELEQRLKEMQKNSKLQEASKEAERAGKREIASLKAVSAEESRRREEAEAYYVSQKEENKRLKGVLKEMKKELEELYAEVTHLKSVQVEREQLLGVVENGDRTQATLLRDCAAMKLEVLRAQRENEAIKIELRHAQSALSRIEALK